MQANAIAKALALLLLLALVACEPQPILPPSSTTPTPVSTRGTPSPSLGPSDSANPTVDPSASANADCGRVIEATEPAGSSSKPRAAFSSGQGVFLYDIAADTIKILDDDRSRGGLNPVFRTAGLVSYVRLRKQPDDGHLFGQDSLYEFDLASGETTEILRLPDSLRGFDWSPDGTLLAYQLRTEIGPVLVCLFDSRNSQTSPLRVIEGAFGTGVGNREESAVTWSPSGRHILTVETAAEPSVFVVDIEGRDVLPPRNGTFARWLSHESVIFQEDRRNLDEPSGGWFIVSTTTGETGPFALPAYGHRPALSPSGDLIAFDDGHLKEPSIYVFDVASETSRMLTRGYVAPIWLGPNLIAATTAGPCPSTDFCVIPWSPLGRTGAIDPVTGDSRSLALPTTLQQSTIRHAVIDVTVPRPQEDAH